MGEVTTIGRDLAKHVFPSAWCEWGRRSVAEEARDPHEGSGLMQFLIAFADRVRLAIEADPRRVY
jgi:hypothetical protein